MTPRRPDAIWWAMPGPRGFLRKITDALTGGRDVVLTLPEQPAQLEDIREQLALSLPGVLVVEAERLSPHNDQGVGTVRQLAAALGRMDSKKLVAADISDELSRHEKRFIWISATHPSDVREWLDLMRALEINSPLAEHRRPPVCLALVGRGAEKAKGLEFDSPCTEISWDGQVTQWDVFVYGLQLFAKRATYLNRHEQELAAFSIADLALWDWEVVHIFLEHLEGKSENPPGQNSAACRLECLLGTPEKASAVNEPHAELFARLIELGSNRGWSPKSTGAWHDGSSQMVNSRPEDHCALLAMRKDGKRLKSRLRKGHVRWAYPFLDDLRNRLLLEHQRRLKDAMNHMTRGTQPDDERVVLHGVLAAAGLNQNAADLIVGEYFKDSKLRKAKRLAGKLSRIDVPDWEIGNLKGGIDAFGKICGTAKVSNELLGLKLVAEQITEVRNQLSHQDLFSATLWSPIVDVYDQLDKI